MKQKIISVIVARGGSKGLPGKNIIPLGGKPLIAYTIKASLGSRYVDTTCVSTDYDDIREVALKYGSEAPFLRPAHLASDDSRPSDAVLHAINFYKENFKKTYDIAIMLQPTSPFRRALHIDEAIEKFLADPTLDSLVSVKKEEQPPWWTFKLEGNRLKRLFEYEGNTALFNTRRQDFPAVYRPNGAIYITWMRYLENAGSIVNTDNNGFYIMSEGDSIDIDTQKDLLVAEAELKRRKK